MTMTIPDPRLDDLLGRWMAQEPRGCAVTPGLTPHKRFWRVWAPACAVVFLSQSRAADFDPWSPIEADETGRLLEAVMARILAGGGTVCFEPGLNGGVIAACRNEATDGPELPLRADATLAALELLVVMLEARP